MFNTRILILVQPAGQLGRAGASWGSAQQTHTVPDPGMVCYCFGVLCSTWVVDEGLTSLSSFNIAHRSFETIP